jgi:16S rRNA (uracil1498-N3)-methyltransferase
MTEPIANTHRFFVDAQTIAQGRTSDADLLHQWVRVLRVRVGDRLLLLDGDGNASYVDITAITPKAATWCVRTTVPAGGEAPLHITLAVSLIRPERFEWLLQKATEIGVNTIVPIKADHSRHDGEVSAQKIIRWRRILREAAEQSCRGMVPRLEAACALRALAPPHDAHVYWCHEGADTIPLRHAPAEVGRPVWLISGPEGSFSQVELAWLMQQPWQAVGLGVRILRAETAPLVAATMLLAQAGAFDGGG